MWNRFSIKIQLILFMTLVISIVEISSLFVILDIQKKDSKNNAILDANKITKSLLSNVLKRFIDMKTDWYEAFKMKNTNENEL